MATRRSKRPGLNSSTTLTSSLEDTVLLLNSPLSPGVLTRIYLDNVSCPRPSTNDQPQILGIISSSWAVVNNDIARHYSELLVEEPDSLLFTSLTLMPDVSTVHTHSTSTVSTQDNNILDFNYHTNEFNLSSGLRAHERLYPQTSTFQPTQQAPHFGLSSLGLLLTAASDSLCQYGMSASSLTLCRAEHVPNFKLT